ncbi:MAG: sugar O-acetyltransferase [Clostridia bacterium]|nr:sugar O-acetyltransferase [Clostridia bacterium]
MFFTFEKLHSGEIYNPADPKIMKVQLDCLNTLYKFNKTKPLEYRKRMRMLKKMFAEMGEGCYIEPPFRANFAGRHIHFGNAVYCNFGCTFVDDTHIYVGNNVMFGPNVVVATAAHPIAPKLREKGLQYNKSVRIGNNCWIGAGALIMPGVTIGDNTVIGAGSVVTKDIPANVVAVGNPCKILREISDELSEKEKEILNRY